MGIRVRNADDEILLTTVLNGIIPIGDHRKSVHERVVQTVDIRCRRRSIAFEVFEHFGIHFADRIETLIAGFTPELVQIIDHAAIGRAIRRCRGICRIRIIDIDTCGGTPLSRSIGNGGILRNSFQRAYVFHPCAQHATVTKLVIVQ